MSTTTTNMSLIQPAVGVTVGPTWSSELNTSLGLIDTHDHTSGKGVQITPSGLNINADLSSTRMMPPSCELLPSTPRLLQLQPMTPARCTTLAETSTGGMPPAPQFRSQTELPSVSAQGTLEETFPAATRHSISHQRVTLSATLQIS